MDKEPIPDPTEMLADLVELFKQAARKISQMHPHCTSTWCMHDRHDQCKTFKSPCRCACHTVVSPS